MKHDSQHYFSSIWHLFFSHFPSNSELVGCNFNWMLIHNCGNKYIKLSVYSNNLCSLKISGLKTLMSVDGNLRHFQCCHPKPKFGRCAHARVLCRKGLLSFWQFIVVELLKICFDLIITVSFWLIMIILISFPIIKQCLLWIIGSHFQLRSKH